MDYPAANDSGATGLSLGALADERSESSFGRAGSHHELALGETDDEVQCLHCGTANEGVFDFRRRCETPLC